MLRYRAILFPINRVSGAHDEFHTSATVRERFDQY